MRRKLIEADLIECVVGLGPNLFYNAAMEACVMICRASKPRSRRGKILFINAVNEVTRERSQSFLTNEHIERIAYVYERFSSEPRFSKVSPLEELRGNEFSLKIDLYVVTPCESNGNAGESKQSEEPGAAFSAWDGSRIEVRNALRTMLPCLKLSASESGALNLVPVADILRNFDRKKWTRVRFGDVVTYVKDIVDPDSGELDRYVAGEHMDTENVHLQRWGTVGEGYLGPAFIRRFRKGQVLYGSRRTYLKKVAYANFDGITANTTFVLEGVEGNFINRSCLG